MRLRDSLSGELRELRPGTDGSVGMYVCGPTVYGRIHVGNARPFVVFLWMKRYLEWRGQPVTLVENITDINDKIYLAAAERGVPSDTLAQEMAQAYIDDTDRLGLGRPDREPRATETLAEIVALIERLIADGHAYEAGGDVYFAVRSYPGYGRLSNQNLDQLVEGARVEPGDHKRDAVDFALWKANKPGEDSWWDSPWGHGRPGWHIECSAMAERWLGAEFALHGGGRDLIFPHHENEIAQSAAAGRPFAQVWAHNGMLRLSGEKMSKSLGNIEPLHVALDALGAGDVSCCSCCAPTTQPIDYTDDDLTQARAAAETLRNRLRESTAVDSAQLEAAFRDALDDDFNTPRALALLFDAPPEAGGSVRELLDVLGLGGLAEEEPAPVELMEKAQERERARADRDFARADALRDELTRPAGRCATPPTARGSTAVAADLVYGLHPVREALRGRREVLRVWCSERVREASEWVPDAAAGRALRAVGRAGRERGSPGDRGRGGAVSLRRSEELLAVDRPLLVALDEVTDPHNLGAVARVAECAGADGLLTTRRRSAAVTPAVCRASAGAVEHLPVAQVENLADTLLRSGGRGCGATPPRGTPSGRSTSTTIATGRCS